MRCPLKIFRIFFKKTEDVKQALVEVGREFLTRIYKDSKTYNHTLGWASSQHSWRFDDDEDADFYDDKYIIIYDWYCGGDSEDVPYLIPYRAIKDMDGAVAEYWEEQAIKAEKARLKKLEETKATEALKNKEEYEEYLRLKAKFEK